jgi:hypothetical protein
MHIYRYTQTFNDFPPRQRAASFIIDRAIEKMAANGTRGGTAGARAA